MVKIETSRLLLRTMDGGDIPTLMEGMNNPNIVRFLVGVQQPFTRQDAINWIYECSKQSEDFSYLGIELLSEGRLIGEIGLSPIIPQKKFGALAYWLLPQNQGNGYASEALKSFTEYSFNDLGLDELEASFFLDNNSSRKLVERLGFRLDARYDKGIRPCEVTGKPEEVYVLRNPQIR